MTKGNVGQLVIVRWDDSSGSHGWENKSIVENWEPDAIESVGWVISSEEQFITIAAHRGNQLKGAMVIPRRQIDSIRKVDYE